MAHPGAFSVPGSEVPKRFPFGSGMHAPPGFPVLLWHFWRLQTNGTGTRQSVEDEWMRTGRCSGAMITKDDRDDQEGPCGTR